MAKKAPTTKCPFCGGELTINGDFCPHCGSDKTQFEEHRAKMKSFEKDFKKTKKMVEKRG